MTRPGYNEVVLLTGFPSFIARKMCTELVRSPTTFVHAIVPPKFEAEAKEAYCALSQNEQARVNLIEGDAAAIDLGLSGVEFKALAGEIDRIHHMAQITDVGADKKHVEHVNLGGAREILEFGAACRGIQNLVFHSSAHVSGDRRGIVLEEELEKGQNFHNCVEESLARSEKMMRAAMPKIPICVVRHTIVVGDSQTGEIDRFEGPYFLISLIVTSPPDFPIALPGRAETPLYLVPVDYVVRATRAIGRDPRAPGRTFHIGDSSPLTVKRVFELVAAACGRRTPHSFFPPNLTNALLRVPGIERLAKSPHAFVDALMTHVTYNFTNTTELLADTEVRCPPFESYVERLVEFVQHRLRDKRARGDSDEVANPSA
ncbi:MAG: SDR family oxidoreductase [Polyangiaceae bacterium]|nr:SDR family oxidoreductase [Polyangiaceae bacterium]